MNFFEHQDQARRQTGKLIALFSFAVLSIVVAVNVAFWLAWIGIGLYTNNYTNNGAIHWLDTWIDWWQTGYGLFVIAATLFLIAVGSLLQWLQLADGGPAVAKKVGARPISDFKNNPSVQQYNNVVSEMAIASGMPVPQLFVLEREMGINAFVAGYQLSDTIMVVTQGLLDTLDRDQLQAVTGHEFSHIAHGDMRLNLQLMSMLSGIVMIGQFGIFLIDTGRHRSHRRSKKDSSALPVLILGIGLWLIGNIGVFFARLIKAAVSRQREFLADASSVQFTRNPDGLAGALYQIQQAQTGSALRSRHKESLSHLCISATTNTQHWLGNLQTHPPLQERIDRISPQFSIKMKHQAQAKKLSEPVTSAIGGGASAFVPGVGAGAGASAGAGVGAGMGAMAAPLLMTTQSILSTVGTAKPAHLAVGQQLYRDIPEKLRTALQQTDGAQAFCLSLILKEFQDPTQIAQAKDQMSEGQRTWCATLGPWIASMPATLRLPCLELGLPTLKALQTDQRKQFIKQIEQLSRFNNQLDMHEWVVLSLLRITLFPRPSKRAAPKVNQFDAVNHAIQTLLSALVHNDEDFAGANTTYKKTVASFGLSQQWLLSKDAVTYDAVSKALWHLGDLNFILRQPLLQACADIVLHDGAVTVPEFEFLRVVSAALECPMPPLTDSLV